jgi:hypothetical protein
VALVKLGCGNNLPGYYMYQGGINPDGKYSFLNEGGGSEDFGRMPVKDYDYMAPLGACGQVRAHYHMLRQQHLFLQEWGSDLALMPARFPQKKPGGLSDTHTVRWSVRSDGSRGYLFFNNYQRLEQLPPKEGVQFLVKLRGGSRLVPSKPMTLPANAYGFWPLNMDCAGLNLAHATAQPLCRLDDGRAHWFFFTALPGIEPEFMIGSKGSHERIQIMTPGNDIAFSRAGPDGSLVHFVVLTPEQGLQLWKMPVAGRMRVVLSANALLPEDDRHTRIETMGEAPATLSIMPAVSSALLDGAPALSGQEGVFQRFFLSTPPPPAAKISVAPVRPGGERRGHPLDAMDEESWKHAAVWRVELPADFSDPNYILRIQYEGDVARFYAGGRLVADNFCNGQPFDTALWRIPPDQWGSMQIHILSPAAPPGITALPRRQWSVGWEDATPYRSIF